MRRSCAVLFSAVLLIAFFLSGRGVSMAESAGPEDPGSMPAVSASGYCVMDADTGEVILSRNEFEPCAPASITKILTALVVLEQVQNPDETAAFTDSALNELDVLSSTLSPMPKPSERFTVRDLLYGLIMRSGNECANLLAEYVSGSTEAFSQLMNERAVQAHALHSHFVNAHGLDDPEHYTCAYDLALLTQAALSDSRTAALLSAQAYTIPATEYCGERPMTSGHAMLNGSYSADVPGVFAGKPGYSPEAGWTLVTAAEREGHRLIAVVMHCGEGCSYPDTELLLTAAQEKLAGRQIPGGARVFNPEVSAYGPDGFTVSWQVGPDAVRADFPVWIEYDETDAMTRDALQITGDTVSCRVDLDAHGGKKCVHTVQAYVYDASGTAQISTVKVLAGLPALPAGFTDWDGGRFYVREDGTVALNWAELPEGAFHFDYLTGRMDTGWIDSGQARFWLGDDGRVHTGWQEIGGSRYYFFAPGDMVTGNAVIDGIGRSFGADGKLQNYSISLEIAGRILENCLELTPPVP